MTHRPSRPNNKQKKHEASKRSYNPNNQFYLQKGSIAKKRHEEKFYKGEIHQQQGGGAQLHPLPPNPDRDRKYCGRPH